MEPEAVNVEGERFEAHIWWVAPEACQMRRFYCGPGEVMVMLLRQTGVLGGVVLCREHVEGLWVELVGRGNGLAERVVITRVLTPDLARVVRACFEVQVQTYLEQLEMRGVVPVRSHDWRPPRTSEGRVA